MEQYVLRKYTKTNEYIETKHNDNAESMYKLFEIETDKLRQGKMSSDVIRIELHLMKDGYNHILEVSHKPKTINQIKEVGYDINVISISGEPYYVQYMDFNDDNELSLFVIQVDVDDIFASSFTLEELSNRTDVAFYGLQEI